MIYALIGFYLAMMVAHLAFWKIWKTSGFVFKRYFYPQKKKEKYDNNVSVELHSNSPMVCGIIIKCNSWHFSVYLCWFSDFLITFKIPALFEKMPQYLKNGREYGFAITKADPKDFWKFVLVVGQNDEDNRAIPLFVLSTKDILLGKQKYEAGPVYDSGKSGMIFPEGEYKAKYELFRATIKRRGKTKKHRMIRIKLNKPLPMPNGKAIQMITTHVKKKNGVSTVFQEQAKEILEARKKMTGRDNWKPKYK